MSSGAHADLYGVLGVPRAASAPEIRRAYRRLARQQHPDLNPDPDGPQRFAALSSAYEILHDPAQRARYDHALARPATVIRPANRTYRPVPPAWAAVRHGILELSPAEALHVERYPLALHDAQGHTILLPAGTQHGDQITVSHDAHTAVLTVQTDRKT
jgi:curved DNA-binding protein CbpA